MTYDEIVALKKQHLQQLADYHKELCRKPRLKEFFIEMTQRCNEYCAHCGSCCGDVISEDLPKEVIFSVLEEVKENFDLRELLLCITGGEPLLRKDFFEIMQYAKDLGFRWGMTSNGTLIDDDVAKKLEQSGMRSVSISIDGLEATHDTFRGVKGAYKKSMQAIQALIPHNYIVQVTTVVTHQNIHELDALFTIFNTMDIDSWRVIGIEPMGRALLRKDLLLTPEDQKTLFRFIMDKRIQNLPVTYGCSHYLGLDVEREVRDHYFICSAGLYVGSIANNGDILACLDIERNKKTIQGNIYKDRFTDVWKDRFDIYRSPLAQRSKICRHCSAKEFCRGGAAHTWDYEEEKQRLCFKDILF